MKICLDSNYKIYLQCHQHPLQHQFQYQDLDLDLQPDIQETLKYQYLHAHLNLFQVITHPQTISQNRLWTLNTRAKMIKIIRPDLHDIIDNLKKSGEWKIQLTMKPKFMSSADSNEKRKMYSKSDSVKVMIGNDTNKII